MNGLQLPNWIVPAAGLAAAVWAIAMWWMVATLPTAGASDTELDLIVARAEIDRLEISVDELAQQVSAFHQERSELALRLDALESNSLVAAIQTAQTVPVAGPPVATATPVASPTPKSEATAAPTAEPTPAPEPVIEATPRPTAAIDSVHHQRSRPVQLQGLRLLGRGPDRLRGKPPRRPQQDRHQ